MMTTEEVQTLMTDLESDRVERTVPFREDKLGPVVCPLSNDFPNHQQPGFILLGVNDNGSVNGMEIGDKELQKIGNIKSNYGVKRAIDELERNNNGKPDFDLTLITKFKVTIGINKHWL